MTFIDWFSGIGGFRLGLEMAGHTCVGHCEIDKYADKSYRAMHDVKESEWFARDITTVEPADLPEADIYCGGFPCQSFSIAGKRGGFEDTRGTLFFEVMRLARVRKPKYLFLENVKGLLSHDGGRTFGTILGTMGELGYDAEYQVLNSRDFGTIQNRERIFIIGHLRQASTTRVFPFKARTGAVNEIQIQKRLRTNIKPIFNISMPESTRRSIASRHTFRDLTPLEYFRLQGFPDELYKKAANVSTKNQLYKQAGNSVTVNVIYEIAKRLKEGD
jgi:DNA (cytosine-5)-methyltransferase 1